MVVSMPLESVAEVQLHRTQLHGTAASGVGSQDGLRFTRAWDSLRPHHMYCSGYTEQGQVFVLPSRLIEGYITDSWKVESKLRNLML